MEIWVRHIIRPHHSHDYIDLYTKREAAYKAAMVSINSILLENRQKLQNCQAEWNSIFDAIKADKWEDAIFNFSKLSEDFGDKSLVGVYSRVVIGNDGENVTLKVADIPCRQCGRGVQPNDKECWWCASKNPAER